MESYMFFEEVKEVAFPIYDIFRWDKKNFWQLSVLQNFHD